MSKYFCICEYCKGQFDVKFKCRTRRFCSKTCARSGENNPSWKGDNVGMQQVHVWVEKALGRPGRCCKCGSIGKVDLANISQEYKRDLDDWEWLCRRCHMDSDGRLEKFLSHSNKFNKIPNRNCNYCGKGYHPYTRHSKYCSHACRTIYRNLNEMDYANRKRRNTTINT